MSRTTKIALGLGAAAVALGAGLGVAGMASATTTPSPTPSPSSSAPGGTFSDGHGMHGGRHGHGPAGAELGTRVKDLAAKLGVDEAKVTDALKAFRDANKPTTPPAEGQKPDRAAMEKALAASLAKSLGIDEAKVTAALEEIRTAEQAQHAAALKPRLDQAVKDGTLTQAEADAVTKAAEKGVIGGR
ncbi:putative membrane protein [Arthrobacter sp. TE12231]